MFADGEGAGVELEAARKSLSAGLTLEVVKLPGWGVAEAWVGVRKESRKPFQEGWLRWGEVKGPKLEKDSGRKDIS